MSLPKVQSLTIRQMRELRELGGDVRTNPNVNIATQVLIDYVMDMHPEIAWDDIPYNEATKFACDVYAFSITPKEEELKN